MPPARIITPTVAEAICSELRIGRLLSHIADDPNFPSHETIWNEIERNPTFREMVARARSASAHVIAESVVQIADAATDDDNPQRIKNRCDQRKWLAGRFNPFYADKPATEINIDMSMSKALAETLEAPTIEHEAKPTDKPSE